MVSSGRVGALYNTDANGRRCAGGFVRVRGRCLEVVGGGGLFDTSLCVETTSEKQTYCFCSFYF